VPIPEAIIDRIRRMADDVVVSTEVRRYMLDLVVFLRMHRAVGGGVSARATRDFELLIRYCHLKMEHLGI
jgi:hypothetical protein